VTPPRLAERLVALSAPDRDREAMLGDLAEELAERAAAKGRARATAWYWRQALVSVVPNLRRLHRAPARERGKGDGTMRGFLADLRFAVRSLLRQPRLSFGVVLTLAAGIGVGAIVFSAVDGIVFHPFPFPDQDRLVSVGTEFRKLRRELSFFENLSPAEYLDIESQSRTLTKVVAWDMGNRQVALQGPPTNLFSAFFWGDAFPTLGMAPALGRGFLAEEIRRGEKVAIVSHRYFQGTLGGDARLLGQRILVNGEPYALVGVMPPRVLIYGTDLWIPMPVGPEAFPRGGRQFQVLARLAPGATLDDANAELAALAARTDQAHRAELAEYEGWRLEARTFRDINVQNLRPAAAVLLGAVALVLLLACANVASLLLARASGRRREMALRVALGARRGQLMRQLLAESAVLALAGAAMGVLVASGGVRAVALALSRLALPVPGEVALNLRVLAVTLAASLVTGLLFGLAPALEAARRDAQAALRAEGPTATVSFARLRLHRAFVGAEVALAAVLVAGSGLLVHSFVKLTRVDPGFDGGNLLTFRITLPQERYDETAIGSFFRELETRLAELPGVEGTASANHFPALAFNRRQFRVEGDDPAAEDALKSAFVTLATPEYFRTLQIPLRAGRLLTAEDRAETRLVAVVSEDAARRFLGGNAIGRRLDFGPESGNLVAEVVGVVGAVKNRGLDGRAEPEIYVSLEQVPGGWNQRFVLVRATGDPLALMPAVREAVRRLDPEQPLYAVQTMEQAYAARGLPRRVATGALLALAAFALALAATGIYAVSSYAAAVRTREIGVRIALGARASQVRAMVARQTLLPVAIGGLAGLLGALALGRVLRGLLFEVPGHDPLTFLLSAAVLAAVAVAASDGPARRASRIDPLRALNSD
jgi:putative ABC transport system permease protein